MKKRMISVVLILAMVLSMGINVFATEWETPIDVAIVAVVNDVDYYSLQEAVNNAGDAVVTLLADSTEAVTTEAELHLDLNGFKASVTAAKIYLYDSSATTEAAGNGKLTSTSQFAKVTTNNDTRYVTVVDKSGYYTAHPFDLRLIDVSLRTEEVGMYYTAELVSDQAVKDAVHSHGVVLSLKDMPGMGFDKESTDAYTVLKGAPVGDFNSGYVYNIFNESKTDATNTTRGEYKIYANAYVRFTDDTVAMSDAELADTTWTEDYAGTAWSLKDAMVRINTYLNDYENKLDEILPFYNTWKNAMASWNLDKIAAAAEAAK